MRVFIRDGLMEMSKDPGSLPKCTFFTHSHPNVLEDFLYEFYSEFPELMGDKEAFLRRMEDAYGSFMAGMWDRPKLTPGGAGPAGGGAGAGPVSGRE
eukprot:496958-Rhodomonas_salina.1